MTAKIWTIMNAILDPIGYVRMRPDGTAPLIPLDVRVAGAQTVLQEIHAPGAPFLGTPVRVAPHQITLTINVEASGLKTSDQAQLATFQRSAFDAALSSIDVPYYIDSSDVLPVPAAVFADPFNEPAPSREVALEAVRNLVELLIAVADLDVGAAWCYALRLPVEIAGVAYRDIAKNLNKIRNSVCGHKAALDAYSKVSYQLGSRLS